MGLNQKGAKEDVNHMRQIMLAMLLSGFAIAQDQVALEIKSPAADQKLSRGEVFTIEVQASQTLPAAEVVWCNGNKQDWRRAKRELTEGKEYYKRQQDCAVMSPSGNTYTADVEVSPYTWLGDGPYPIFAYAVDAKSHKLLAISEIREFQVISSQPASKR